MSATFGAKAWSVLTHQLRCRCSWMRCCCSTCQTYAALTSPNRCNQGPAPGGPPLWRGFVQDRQNTALRCRPVSRRSSVAHRVVNAGEPLVRKAGLPLADSGSVGQRDERDERERRDGRGYRVHCVGCVQRGLRAGWSACCTCLCVRIQTLERRPYRTSQHPGIARVLCECDQQDSLEPRALRPERSSAPIVPGRSWTAEEPEKTGSERETGPVFEPTHSAQQTLSTSSGAHPRTFE